MVGPSDRTAGKALDLTTHRALAVQLEVEGPAPASGQSPVLNVQLEAGGKTYRDYYIDLDFRGRKTIVLPEPGTSRMLAEFRPAYSNYPFKMAMYSFNYGNVVALNLRWMRYAKGSGVRCRVSSVEALEERSSGVEGLRDLGRARKDCDSRRDEDGRLRRVLGRRADSCLRPERCSASNCGSQSRANAEGGRKQVNCEGLKPRECEADSDYLRQVIRSCECLLRQDRF